MSENVEITALLKRFQEGDDSAASILMDAVYDELRLMARRYMARERDGHTLQTTALVNEAYLKLVHCDNTSFHDRSHFFAVAAQVMRRILVDHARKHVAGKRGGGADFLPLDEGLVYSPERSSQVIQLDEALSRLSALDPRAGRVIELRFFGGLSLEETAAVMEVSTRTVRREWNFGRAWLRQDLGLSVAE
jgi:RNA polymerase sigma-70 factor, ECF subfamily